MEGTEPDLLMPWVESPFFEEILVTRGLKPEQALMARAFHDQGFLLLEDAVSPALLDRVRAEVEPRFHATPGVAADPRLIGARFMDAWRDSGAVRELACLPSILDLLRMLYGREPIPFLTLHFHAGSEQGAHSDTIHFHCFPPLYMCGAWVALEDVGADAGPLFYYPGSHRLPQLTYADAGIPRPKVSHAGAPGTFDGYDRYERLVDRLMRSAGLQPVELHVRKGTMLVWAAGLVHGGAPVRDRTRTRFSQVTHYFFSDCLYYCPILSRPLLGDLFLSRVVDIRTGAVVPHRIDGVTLPDPGVEGSFRAWLDEAPPELVPSDEAPRRATTRLEAERDAVAARARELEDLLGRVQRSPSFRLGRALTAPLRFLRGSR